MTKITKRLLAFMLAVVLIMGMNTTSVFAAGSTLKISGNTAITQLTQGKSWSCNGTISSNYKLTNVTGAIKDSSGTVKYSKSVNPGAKSYALKGSAVDSALKFGKLTVGTYSYIISATDASGKNLTLVNNSFSVVLAAGSGTASTLKITDAGTISTLQAGKGWSTTGTISSNYALTNVTGKISDSTGNVKYSKAVNPNAASYVLKGSAIDNALLFSKLSAGTYRYVIAAKDASGKTLTLVDNLFTVTDGTSTGTSTETTTKEESTLKITGVTAISTIAKGKSQTLSGTITSNYKLTNVTGKILDSNGTAKYSKSVNPAATSYALKGSAVDNALSFGKLAAGTYRYTIDATDASGKTLTLVDNLFTVTDGTSTGTTTQAESTLKITDATAITTLVKGKGWSPNGTISSNYKLTNVTGKILDTDGTAKYTKSVNPAAASYALKSSAIDNALLFSKLTVGSYRYTIEATDASGKTLTLVDNLFTVTDGTTTTETTKAESTLKITGATTLTTLTQGKTWSLSGTISSNYKLTNVTGKILDSTGAIKYAKAVNPAATSYALKGSTIDNSLSFGKLAVGTYQYVITATDASEKTLTLVDNTFTVTSGTTGTTTDTTGTTTGTTTDTTGTTTEPAAESTLTITGATPVTTVKQGNYWHCNGTITSNYTLTSVNGMIVDANGNTKYNYTVNPNATSYVLKYSTIDDAMGFSKLPVGTYRYILTAGDASGKTAILVDNTFTVE